MGSAVGMGLTFVVLGGLLQGSFTLPMKRMPAWRWENTWLVYSVAAMLVMPWLLVIACVPHTAVILRLASPASLVKVALFGFGWGVGSVLFGLGITALGMSLGFAIILGLTASIGSLLPLIVLGPQRLFSRQGYALILSLILVIVGILLCGLAGSRREQEKRAAVVAQSGRLRFSLGLLICSLSGVFSPMLNFSFVFGKNLQHLTLQFGAKPAMASNLVWATALGAGFVANSGYSVYLLYKNRSWGLLSWRGTPIAYWLGSLLMAFLWFADIAIYGVGATDLGSLGGVIGWPVFTAVIIIVANLWGAATGEWTGARRSTYAYSWWGIGFLLVAIYVISRGSAS